MGRLVRVLKTTPSADIIDEERPVGSFRRPLIPQQSASDRCLATYRCRFGSLRRAYEPIGYGRPEQFGGLIYAVERKLWATCNFMGNAGNENHSVGCNGRVIIVDYPLRQETPRPETLTPKVSHR